MIQKEQKKLIKRDIFPHIADHLSKKEITLITGARQVGKTVLLGMLEEFLIKKKKVLSGNILYFNLDIVKDWDFFQDQTRLIEFLQEKISESGKIYLIVDEAQRISECGRFFKGIYDSGLNLKMVLTGSASLELKTQFQESLTGRKRVFHLSSFSFLEFLRTKDKKLAKLLDKSSTRISSLSKRKLKTVFQEYIVWGGYPRVVLTDTKKQKKEILAELFTSYIEKDIVGFLGVKNRLSFSKLVKLLAGQTGQLVNISELSSSLNIRRETIEKYLKALEETFIISPLYPYFKNPRQEVIKQNKIYFNDLGLRNYALEDFSAFKSRDDKGHVLENAIFREILLQAKDIKKLRFWRTKQGSKVDFLLFQGKKIIALEAKTNLKKPVIPVGLRSLIKKYLPNEVFVVNLSLQDKIKVNNTIIKFIYPFDFKKVLN